MTFEVGTSTCINTVRVDWSYGRNVSDDSINPLKDALDNQEYTWDKNLLHARAHAFAKLFNKMNTGSQTVERSFCRDVDSQIYLPVEHESNTGIGKSSNSEVQRSFYSGLHVPGDSRLNKHVLLLLESK